MVLVALIAASKGVMNCVASFDHLVGKRELARTRFLWPLVTALRLLSESDATFIAAS
jgi:hypothetical protein